MAYERGAISNVSSLAFELGVGEEDEPCPEGGAIGFIGEADLGRQARAKRGGNDHHRGGKLSKHDGILP